MPFRLLPTQQARTVAEIDRLCWLTVIGCVNGHSKSFTGPDMIARFPAGATIGQIAERLVCSECGSADGEIGFVQDRSPRAQTKGRRKSDGPPGHYDD